MSAPFSKNRWYRLLAESVSPGAFHIGYLLVENFLFPGKADCWATQETLAKLGRTSPRNVRRLVTEIIDSGLLGMRRGGKGHANRYVPVLLERTNLSGQKENGKAFDRTDSSYDDRPDLSSDIPEQSPGSRDGPPQGPDPALSPAGLEVVGGDPSSPVEIDDGASAGLRPALANDETFSSDVEEAEWKKADARESLRSASTLDPDDEAPASPKRCREPDPDDDCCPFGNPSPWPSVELFREQMGYVPESFREFREFLDAEGLRLAEGELETLAEEIGHSEADEEAAARKLAGREPDADDLDRLRRGIQYDRHGRPYEIVQDGRAFAMLHSEARRASYVGRLCDRLSAKRESDREPFWRSENSALHAALRREGYGISTYNAAVDTLSAEVRAEMKRRDQAFARRAREAVL